ncbi:MAG: ATP-dependent DNA helicase RecG [Gemmataceae bacterium]
MSCDDPLRQPLERLPGATPARRELLARLGLGTIGDLLYHFPRSYEDLTELRPIAGLLPELPQTIQGEVVEIESRSLNHGRILVSVVVSDDNQSVLEAVWFNQPHAARRFRFGQRVSFSGKPRWHRDHWQMTSPRVQILDGTAPATPGIVPVYPLTEDLRPETLRQLIGKALDLHGSALIDRIPTSLREQHGWPNLVEAFRQVHFPESLEAAKLARERFVYEELLVLQVGLALRRRELRDRQRAPVLAATTRIDQRIRALFPFPLTADQDRAIAEICADLNSPRPMQRLVQADVGAGKTAIAVYAMLVAVACKHQAALMAPTEVLARQHADTLDRYLAHSRVRRLLLTGGLTARQRREALEALRAGTIDLVVGTQSLAQEGVEFARLGLVVIDEQHKFGVHQRARVRQLGADPHYLIMTATPIPRTVALTVFGDLDTTFVRELPPGRQPVTSRWLREQQRDALYDQIRTAVGQGHQVYVVCPLVEDSQTANLRSAVSVHRELSAGPFRDLRLGLLHGQLDDEVKATVLEQFRIKKLDILVCTSVVEVGVDVPNATWLVIEHADRFGLSQLHQLRGRVSRGTSPGQCFLFAQPATEASRDRLQVFLRTTDGFHLAEEDARLRGTGELFGTRQHGGGELWALGQASLVLLDRARRDASAIVAEDAGLRQPDHAALRDWVVERYGKTLELAEVG